MNVAKKSENLNKTQHIEFSAISGYNYYYLPDGLPAERLDRAIHAQSGQQVYLKEAKTFDQEISDRIIKWYRQCILDPMTTKYSEWPVDLLHCQTSTGQFILYYVFPERAFPEYQPIRNLLYQRKDSTVLDWRSREICQVCRCFLEAMIAMEDAGYRYTDFSIDRILYQKKSGAIMLRHTPLVRRAGYTLFLSEEEQDMMSVEFAPPYMFQKKFDGRLPDQAEYFSIAALLFRLMIGRLPYEGKGLANYGDVFEPLRDRDPLSHRNYFVHYQNYPHFIFDKHDDSNRLAPMQENDLPRERWEALPAELQRMFRCSLSQDTAEQLTQEKLFPAWKWLEVCNQQCWNDQKYER